MAAHSGSYPWRPSGGREGEPELEAAMQVAEAEALNELEARHEVRSLPPADAEFEAFIGRVWNAITSTVRRPRQPQTTRPMARPPKGQSQALAEAQRVVATWARFYSGRLVSEPPDQIIKRAQADAIGIRRGVWPPLRALYSQLTSSDMASLARELVERVQYAATRREGYRLEPVESAQGGVVQRRTPHPTSILA